MKPSWDDAPCWANWLVMESNGHWYWYENRPSFDFHGRAYDGGDFDVAQVNEDMRTSAEPRP